MTAAISLSNNSVVLTRRNPPHHLHHQLSSPGSSHIAASAATKLSLGSKRVRKLQLVTSTRPVAVQASYSDGERHSSASIFVGGFVLGGLIVGALGCVYAPQISKALAGADRKDLMKKLPKFIYDEEKALEKTRKVLAEKIAQLNLNIDDVSAQLRSEDTPNGVPVTSDEVEAGI